MRRLLCVTAHPDDEAAAFGGTLLLYASRGVETYVICLTAGEAGPSGTATSRNELAELRRAEFARACEILKVSNGEVLGYADGNLHKLAVCGPTADLAYRIRRIRPQVLLTFGPDGGTGHADHSMACVFATFAFHWAARDDWFVEQLNSDVLPYQVPKLYYLTSEFAFPGRRPLCLAPTSAILDVGDFVEDKIRAFQAHTTQARGATVETVIRQQGGKETYHLAAAFTPRTMSMEADLFSSVT